MLSVLLKKQLTEIFRNYFYNPKTNKARSKAAVAAYIVLFAVLMVVILGGMFTVLSAALCTPLTAAGLDWLYFALMALLATLLGAFGSVFNTYSGLYLAKDNDLLLSMPIPVNTLMASRLLGVYLMGLMYSGVVMLPAVIVYWVATPGTDRRRDRRRAAGIPAVRVRIGAVLYAGLAGGQDQPEAEK